MKSPMITRNGAKVPSLASPMTPVLPLRTAVNSSKIRCKTSLFCRRAATRCHFPKSTSLAHVWGDTWYSLRGKDLRREPVGDTTFESLGVRSRSDNLKAINPYWCHCLGKSSPLGFPCRKVFARNDWGTLPKHGLVSRDAAPIPADRSVPAWGSADWPCSTGGWTNSDDSLHIWRNARRSDRPKRRKPDCGTRRVRLLSPPCSVSSDHVCYIGAITNEATAKPAPGTPGGDRETIGPRDMDWPSGRPRTRHGAFTALVGASSRAPGPAP